MRNFLRHSLHSFYSLQLKAEISSVKLDSTSANEHNCPGTESS